MISAQDAVPQVREPHGCGNRTGAGTAWVRGHARQVHDPLIRDGREPYRMALLYDAHVHLSDPHYEPDMDHTLRCMESLQIAACCVSEDTGTSARTLGLAERSRLVLPFVGIHPGAAGEDTGTVEGMVEGNPSGIAGIGEIGLDRTLAPDGDMARQRSVFERMLALAERFGKPVSVHSRRTLDDVLDALPSFGTGGTLLHWFDGNRRQLGRAMDMGCYVSYGPVAVYAGDKQALLARTDRDRILVETDGPVPFSRCFGGRNAQVSFIPSVVLCVSNTLDMPYSGACRMLSDNTRRFLGTAK